MHIATPEELDAFLDTPGSNKVVVHRVQRVEINPRTKEDQFVRQRAHWKKLHTTRFTAEEFEAWVKSIPGCPACQRDFRKLIAINPPRFDDWQRWTWEIHNAVNVKLGKPEIDWETACKLWSWNINAKEVSYDDTT